MYRAAFAGSQCLLNLNTPLPRVGCNRLWADVGRVGAVEAPPWVPVLAPSWGL